MLNLLKRRWYFFVLGIFSLLVFVIIILSIFKSPLISQPPPIPTPVPLNNVSVTHSSLDQNTNKVSIVSPLQFLFSNTLPPDQQRQVTITVSPQLPTKAVWSNNTLLVVPSAPMQEDTTYSVNLGFGGQTKNYTFTTGSVSDLSEQEKTILQNLRDVQYGNAVNKQYDLYPWLNNMPLQDSNYFVYFDASQKSFIAKLYPNKNSAQSIDQQVASLKTTVINQINSLNGAGKYPILWNVIPES